MKKHKFLSIFAIMFALVFALSICFFAACGSDDDDKKDNDTTVTTPEDETKDEDTTEDESEGDDTTKDEDEEKSDGDEKKDEDEKKEDDEKEDGNDDDDDDDNDDGLVTSFSVDFSKEESYSWIPVDDKKVENDTTYTQDMVTLVTSKGYKNNEESQGAKDNIQIGNVSGALTTGGYSEDGSGRYFIIDLTDYVGEYGYVSVTADMRSHSKDSNRSLYLDTDYMEKPSESSATILTYVTSETSSNNARQTLDYVCAIAGDCSKLYLTCDASIDIFSIDIEIGDDLVPAAAVSSVSIAGDDLESGTALGINDTTTLTATVNMEDADADYQTGHTWTNGGYTWSVESTPENEGETEVVTLSNSHTDTVEVNAVAVGEATVTVRLWADPSKTITYIVTVVDAAPVPQSLEISVEFCPDNIGGTDYIDVTITMSDGSAIGLGDYEGEYTWSFDPEGTIELTGEVKATNHSAFQYIMKGEGIVTITVELDDGVAGSLKYTFQASGDVPVPDD